MSDAVQEILLLLFANNARRLRAWDRSRGLSLENYVGLITERVVGRKRRHRSRDSNGHESVREDPIDTVVDTSSGPENILEAREMLARIIGSIASEVSLKGAQLFESLLLDETPVYEVLATSGMTRDSLYVWRCRLRQRVRAMAKAM